MNPQLEEIRASQKDDMTERLALLESRICAIEERNRRVESEKAWETSRARIIAIALLTYLVTSIVFWALAVPRPFLNSIIPTTAFVLSTLSLPFLKQAWLRRWQR